MKEKYSKYYKIEIERKAALPIPLVFMQKKEEPPTFFRFLSIQHNSRQQKIPVIPFYKPISKIVNIDEKRR